MIETYEIEEGVQLAQSEEFSEEWKSLVEKAGLTGQTEMLNKEGVGSSPIPFQPLNVKMQKVFEVLCPLKCKVAEYKRSTIPLRVLSFVALSVEKGYFDEIQVWCDDMQPDPVIVGIADKQMFLVARWGDELRNFIELEKMAFERYIKEKTIEAKDKIAELQEKVANAETMARKYFKGDWVWWN